MVKRTGQRKPLRPSSAKGKALGAQNRAQPVKGGESRGRAGLAANYCGVRG